MGVVLGGSSVLKIGFTGKLADFLAAPPGSNHLSSQPRVVNVAIVMEEVPHLVLAEDRYFKISMILPEIALQETTYRSCYRSYSLSTAPGAGYVSVVMKVVYEAVPLNRETLKVPVI